MLILLYFQTACWDKCFGVEQLMYFHLIDKSKSKKKITCKDAREDMFFVVILFLNSY